MPFNRIMGSVVNPINLAQIAMGPAGWASLALRTIGSQIAMNAIQQLGQQLGLPQWSIDMVQANFASSIGMPGLARQEINQAVRGVADQFNLSPRDEAGLQQAAQFDVRDFMQQMERAIERGRTAGEGRSRSAAAGGGSILEIIAEAMISAMHNKVGEMQDLARQMDNVKHQKGKTDSVEINTKLQVATQEFSMMMNATNNMIKTIGEGLSTMARKG